MKEKKMKEIVGISILSSHFLLISVVLILFFLGGFSFDEMTTSLYLMVPIFSVYVAAIVKYFTNNRFRTKDKSKEINGIFVFLTFFLLVICVVFLLVGIFLKSFNIGFNDFEQFKLFITTIESLFGVYLGTILSSLFNIKVEKA